MTFRFLGHPSLQEVETLKQYVQTRHDEIGPLLEALNHEVDVLRKTLAKYSQAESMLHSEQQFDKDSGLERYVKAPVLNEDLGAFERFKFDNAETASLVDKILHPFESNLRARERVGYKVKKLLYLIESKSLMIEILTDLQDDLRDEQ